VDGGGMKLGGGGRKSDIAWPIPEWARSHPAWLRLEDQIDWYDSKSTAAQRWYKLLKFVQIFLAVLIPIATHFPPEYVKWVTAISGSMIALLEGVQHLNQYSTLWVTYRGTAEYLKHEKFLFLSGAGPYKDFTNEQRLLALAERVEERVSTEHANWFNETRRVQKATQPGTSSNASR
jgi:hypothetical protein